MTLTPELAFMGALVLVVLLALVLMLLVRADGRSVVRAREPAPDLRRTRSGDGSSGRIRRDMAYVRATPRPRG